MAMAAITVLGQAALQALKLCDKCCKDKEKYDDDKKEGDQNGKDNDKQEDDDVLSDINMDENESESEPEEKKESESESKPEEKKESESEFKPAEKKESESESEPVEKKESKSESEPAENKESAPMIKKKRTTKKKRSTDNKRSNACSEDKKESESESEPEEKKESAPMNRKKRTAKKKRSTENKRSNACSVPDIKPITTQPFMIQTTINPVFYNNFQPHPSAIAPGVPPWVPPNGTASATSDQNVVKWEDTSIDNAIEFMDTAIVGGYDIDETDLWIIRARFKCEVIPGKLNQFHKLAFIPYKTQKGYVERNIDYFEVLCIATESRNRIRWTACSNGVAPKNAVEAGRKASGEKLYIGRAIQEDEIYPGRHSLCPGMVQPSHGVLYVTYGFKVYAHKCYEVLCIDD